MSDSEHVDSGGVEDIGKLAAQAAREALAASLAKKKKLAEQRKAESGEHAPPREEPRPEAKSSPHLPRPSSTKDSSARIAAPGSKDSSARIAAPGSKDSSARIARPTAKQASSSRLPRPNAKGASSARLPRPNAKEASSSRLPRPNAKGTSSARLPRPNAKEASSAHLPRKGPPRKGPPRKGPPSARLPAQRRPSGPNARPSASGRNARTSGHVQRVVRPSGKLARPSGKSPATSGRSPSGRATRADSQALPSLRSPTRKRLRRFSELGWESKDDKGVSALAVDIGAESSCITTFEKHWTNAKDSAQPTMTLVKDPHAFRSLEAFSLEFGLEALERWPAQDVLRGTHGSILLPSQIGLVDFPAEHVLSGLVRKVRDERKKLPKEVVLTLPTFLPSDRDARIRENVSPRRKGGFRGVPASLAAAYFYMLPGLEGLDASNSSLRTWARSAKERQQALILDWGASGLEYGLAEVRPSKAKDKEVELRLLLAGVWPSLGGHRLTLGIVQELKQLLIDAIFRAGPSDDLVPVPLLKKGGDEVPRPPGYEDAFALLRAMGSSELLPHVEQERQRLRSLLFPTAWRYPHGGEPQGFAPYRRMAIQHFKVLWKVAERLKRLILSDPAKYHARGVVAWNLERLADSPFCSHLEFRSLDYRVEPFLRRVQHSLDACLAHIDRRLSYRNIDRVHVALTGMQAATPLLNEAVETHAASDTARAMKRAEVCPASSDPLELKSVVNRGASLLTRDKRKVDFGPPVDVLPFNVQIADCLGNVLIFAAGPIDELAVFQRRIRVEDGFPQFEFYVYDSEDGTESGSWGAIDFHRPTEFTERDRVFAVDPRYGFGGELPLLRDLKGDQGKELASRCFDRGTQGHGDGSISFRSYAPRESGEARRLLHFLEYGLTGEFHRKVYLLEREFLPPPRRFDYVYQRYYLSRSQELLVVREWWAPKEGGKLMRNKTLHTCQGTTEANAILGLQWGTY